jgi:hypothetical protein
MIHGIARRNIGDGAKAGICRRRIIRADEFRLTNIRRDT